MGNCTCLPRVDPRGERVTDWLQKHFSSSTKKPKADDIVTALVVQNRFEGKPRRNSSQESHGSETAGNVSPARNVSSTISASLTSISKTDNASPIINVSPINNEPPARNASPTNSASTTSISLTDNAPLTINDSPTNNLSLTTSASSTSITPTENVSPSISDSSTSISQTDNASPTITVSPTNNVSPTRNVSPTNSASSTSISSTDNESSTITVSPTNNVAPTNSASSTSITQIENVYPTSSASSISISPTNSASPTDNVTPTTSVSPETVFPTSSVSDHIASPTDTVKQRETNTDASIETQGDIEHILPRRDKEGDTRPVTPIPKLSTFSADKDNSVAGPSLSSSLPFTIDKLNSFPVTTSSTSGANVPKFNPPSGTDVIPGCTCARSVPRFQGGNNQPRVPSPLTLKTEHLGPEVKVKPLSVLDQTKPTANPLMLRFMMRTMAREGIKPHVRAIDRIKADSGVCPDMQLVKRLAINKSVPRTTNGAAPKSINPDAISPMPDIPQPNTSRGTRPPTIQDNKTATTNIKRLATNKVDSKATNGAAPETRNPDPISFVTDTPRPSTSRGRQTTTIQDNTSATFDMKRLSTNVAAPSITNGAAPDTRTPDSISLVTDTLRPSTSRGRQTTTIQDNNSPTFDIQSRTNSQAIGASKSSCLKTPRLLENRLESGSNPPSVLHVLPSNSCQDNSAIISLMRPSSVHDFRSKVPTIQTVGPVPEKPRTESEHRLEQRIMSRLKVAREAREAGRGSNLPPPSSPSHVTWSRHLGTSRRPK